MTKRQKLKLAALIIIAPVVYLTVIATLLVHYGNTDQAQKADAIIVFGARVHPGGKPSPILRGRIWHAFELWKKGLAPKIVCTGGVGDNPPAEAVVEKGLLENWGVPAKDILVDDRSTSTHENVVNGAALLPRDATVIAVSEPFHLWRCRRECRMQGLEVFISPERTAWDPLIPRVKIYYAIREALLVTRDVLRFWN